MDVGPVPKSWYSPTGTTTKSVLFVGKCCQLSRPKNGVLEIVVSATDNGEGQSHDDKLTQYDGKVKLTL